MSSDPESPPSQALRYISASHFHRLFKYDDLSFSYADIGVPSDTTILFMPGMFASRYLAVSIHEIAKSMGVRVLIVDRPGMGASTPVPLEKRVPVWIDFVPRLLSHLNIPNVALVSHSAGMIYLLNTLYHCRELLHPERPYVAFLAPWVNPIHSRIKSMQMAQFLPTPIFSIWNQIPRFLLLTATPVLESSGTMVKKVSSVSRSVSIHTRPAQMETERDQDRVDSTHRLPDEVKKELEPLTWRFMFEESTKGANDEAVQCLYKGPSGSWGVCEDYEGYVGEVVERERKRRTRRDGEDAGGRLMVRGYFAESDTMIGEKGRGYVERCWRGGFDDVLDFKTEVIQGTDHNDVSQETGLLKRIFFEAGGHEPSYDGQ